MSPQPEMVIIMVDQKYYILSRERPGGPLAVWWGPNGSGYTTDVSKAGVYTSVEAREIETKTDIAIPVDDVINNIIPVARLEKFSKFRKPSMSNGQYNRTAVISDCGQYRYKLTHEWDSTLPTLGWIMLNPSTADSNIDDATIRRCVGFAKRNQFGSIKVANLFAFRSTCPDKLKVVSDPVGNLNDRHIVDVLNESKVVLLAWGAHGGIRSRNKDVLGIVSKSNTPCRALAYTKSGDPCHPLRLPYTPMESWFAINTDMEKTI